MSLVAVTWPGMLLSPLQSHLFEETSHFLPHTLTHFLFHGVNLAHHLQQQQQQQRQHQEEQEQSLKRISWNHLAITCITIPIQFNPSSLKHFLKQDILPCIKVNWIGCQCHRLLSVLHLLLLPLHQPQGLHPVLKDHHNFLLRPSGKNQILFLLLSELQLQLLPFYLLHLFGEEEGAEEEEDGVRRKLVLRNTHLMLILPLMTTCIEAIASYFLMATLAPLKMLPMDITSSVLGGKATCNFFTSHQHLIPRLLL